MNILVVDDDALVSNGIKTILETATREHAEPYRVVGLGQNGHDAIRLYEEHAVDVVLLDIRMPEMNGIEAGRLILKKDPQAKIIYLTTFLEDDYIVDALKLGAKGYLLKTDFASLITAIAAVAEGQRVFGDEIIAKIPAFLESAPPETIQWEGDLSEKEREIIQCVAEGLNNKEIAEELHFSEGTIRNYLSIILEKLNLRDRTQLAIYYYKHLHG